MNGTLRAWNRIERARRQYFQPRPPLNVWQWAEASVDFSRAPNYDTPLHGQYDAAWMPYWKEVVENLTDNRVREVVVLKATRAGGSENVLLNAIRYAVAMRPQPVLYVTSDQLSAERFMDRRVKRGLKCAESTAKALRQAQTTQHDISFPTMDFRVTWPRAKQAFKQDGWACVLCDELSTWPEYSADMARRRCDSYPFPHIVFLSSPDPAQKRPSSEDPIFVEHARGDRRVWTCKDPATGNDFVLRFGERGKDGIQWPDTCKREDDTWDYDAIEAQAYYVTPDGTRIESRQRMDIVRGGRWVATNPAAPAAVRSYHVTSLMVPFSACDFGAVAVAFLKAKARGAMALRGFAYEYMAEPFSQALDFVADDETLKRAGGYARGGLFHESPSRRQQYQSIAERPVYITVDVQKAHVWWVARAWCRGGDSGLIDYGAAAMWSEVYEVAAKHRAALIMVDNSYEVRAPEVYEECYRNKMVPCFGRSQCALPFLQSVVDPFEGKVGGGRTKIPKLTFNPDIYKTLLMSMMRGESQRQWYVYDGIDREYARQITAEQCVDGEWQTRPGHSANHLFDCEVLQLLAAHVSGIYSLASA